MRRRFKVDSVEPDAAGRIDLDAVRSHLEVVRADVGDVIRVFDGSGAEVEAEIVAFDGSVAAAVVRAAITNESESKLECWLVQALPARASRMDAVVRQATELGVDRILPVVAERSQQSKATPAGLQHRGERWRRIAVAAAEQCRRPRVPEVEMPCGFEALQWHRLPAPILIAALEAAPPARFPEQRAVSVLVGPEGGWTEHEFDAALAAGAQPFGLGPRVLRADTAGVVAISLFQTMWGDLR